MRGEGSLFSHKLLKSLIVVGQKTLHQLDREGEPSEKQPIVFSILSVKLQVSYKEFTMPVALGKCGDTFLFFDITTSPW